MTDTKTLKWGLSCSKSKFMVLSENKAIVYFGENYIYTFLFSFFLFFPKRREIGFLVSGLYLMVPRLTCQARTCPNTHMTIIYIGKFSLIQS